MPNRWAVPLTLLTLLQACSSVTEVEAPELARVVERDLVTMEGGVPPELVDRIASVRVAVVGEIHFLQEHRELVGALVRALHARGFRQLLMEWPHAYDWVLSEYVVDGDPMPGWQPPQQLGGVLIEDVRAFNRMLPPEGRVRLGAVDLNLDEYGGAEVFLGSLEAFVDRLSDPGPVGAFLEERYVGPERQRRLLERLGDELADGRDEWTVAWGRAQYRAVVEMVDVERASIAVRALRGERYDVSTRLRERAIHRLADQRIAEMAGGTVINIGLTHAQKRGLFGTESTTWLSDYLVHESPVANGSVFVLGAVAAQIWAMPDGPLTYQLDGSPANELFRLVYGAGPDGSTFLPLDDPLFSGGGVPLNVDSRIYVCAPNEVFDGIVLYPLAHRDPP